MAARRVSAILDGLRLDEITYMAGAPDAVARSVATQAVDHVNGVWSRKRGHLPI
jgi:hypothetical protein